VRSIGSSGGASTISISSALLMNETGVPSHYAFHLIAQLADILNIDGCNDLDPGIQQVLDILPAGWIPRARRVVVSQTVNEADRGVALEQRIDVNRHAIINLFERDHLQIP